MGNEEPVIDILKRVIWGLAHFYKIPPSRIEHYLEKFINQHKELEFGNVYRSEHEPFGKSPNQVIKEKLEEISKKTEELIASLGE